MRAPKRYTQGICTEDHAMNSTAPKPLAAIATLLVMTLSAGGAAAQSEPDYMDAVMRVGGQMHAAAEMCGFQNVSEAPARKREQR